MTNVFRVFLILGVALLTQTARADTTQQKAAAEVMFQDARRLAGEGNYVEACNKFARSHQLDPAVGTLLNLGDCYKHIGKTASAWLAYREAIALAKSRNDERRSAAEEEAHQLEPDLARVKIEFAGMIPGVSVILNGEPVDPSNFATAIPVDPGDVTVEASAPGRKEWRQSVNIAAASSKTVTVPELEDLKPPSNPLAMGLAIGGGAAVTAGLVFGVIAMSKWNNVDEACPNRTCPNAKTLQAFQPESDTAQLLAHFSTGLVAVGTIAAVSGLYLYLSAPKKRVSVGLQGPNLALRAQF